MIRNYHSLTWWAGAFLLMILLTTGVNIGFTIWQVEHSQQQLCNLLEAVPAPSKTQQTPQGFTFFTRLKVLESQYGCAP